MASSSSSAPPEPIDIPQWLKSLPLAPEYHPTLHDFQDPISFILKIEKEASSFGICKIVPPLPPPPKKTTLTHLNRSFAARSPHGGGGGVSSKSTTSSPPTFTTRQQQIGFCPRRPRPVQKPVWQSGETYTLPQFESKAKHFERSYLKKSSSSSSTRTTLTPLETESLFWKACADRPFSVEYANDMPGSGFAPVPAPAPRRAAWRDEASAATAARNVGESAWNMRGVSRSKGSLLRFMREEIPGVTSPMVYVAMLFSWFAWHAEDHELHSLNYLHMGAGKTWYGVPRDAALAFEEVVRVQGYGGEVNPLVTFTILGEKTTVMSPEVLVSAGIPCCRLVQNTGEFVVTFPGAYHSGFSHGFNCGEAANIATPEWLKVAKEAAIRRASTNYPPMVSHFQLLYTHALSLCSRMPMTVGSEPRSSRLKDKMKGEGEAMIKDIFVQNVIETNDLLSILHDKGSSCTVLPHNAPDSPLCSNSFGRSHLKIKPRLSLGLCSREEALEASNVFPSNDVMLGKNPGVSHLSAFSSLKGSSLAACQGTRSTSESCNKSGTAAWNFLNSDSQHLENEKEAKVHGDGLLDQGMLSCVTCGILSFTCVAVVHPREDAARYLMSVDYGFLNDQNVCSGEISDVDNETNWKRRTGNLVSGSGQMENHQHDVEVDINDTAPKGISALALLVSAYGDSSDSEEERLPEISICTDKNNSNHEGRFSPKHFIGADGLSDENSRHIDGLDELRSIAAKDRCNVDMEFSDDNKPENVKCDVLNKVEDNKEMTTSSCSIKSTGEPMVIGCREVESCHTTGNVSIHQSEASLGSIAFGSTGHFGQPDVFCSSAAASGNAAKTTESINVDAFRKISTILVDKPDKDSSRMHVFCLEHAVEVEKLLRPIGGVNITLLCHPDYPKIEAEAKSLAEELGNDYIWKDIDFKEATQEDQEIIRVTLQDEESIPTNSDWAVKMGINLYYSANLSKSPLYSKQMPYNTVIYKAFGCSSPNNSPVKPKPNRRKLGRQKKIIVAGKWCGKVWMSNQVHPYLAHRKDAQERELSVKLDHVTPESKPQKFETESDNKLVQPKNSQKRVSDARKSGRRRKKNPSVMPITKKPRCTPQELDDSSINPEDVAEISPACGMVLRSCRKLTVKDEDGEPKTVVRRGSPKAEVTKMKSTTMKKEIVKKKAKKAKAYADPVKKSEEAEEYACDIEGCLMNFRTKQDLMLHKKDICPEKGCGKKFFSHKYLVQHRKVHMDDRPLECPWKGCDMRFKWAWARTEHIRVHTGDRPYVCMECGKTFRFVSDFSRHKRKTGHVVKKGRR